MSKLEILAYVCLVSVRIAPINDLLTRQYACDERAADANTSDLCVGISLCVVLIAPAQKIAVRLVDNFNTVDSLSTV